MIDIMVFNASNFIGTVSIFEPGKDEVITRHENVKINNNVINILYFRDLEYAILLDENTNGFIDGIEYINSILYENK